MATQMRTDLNEMEAQGLLADSIDSIHYGLVELGGFTRYSDLTPDQRRHMYTQERGNLIASRTMCAQGYLSVVRQWNHGIAEGQDTSKGRYGVGGGCRCQ